MTAGSFAEALSGEQEVQITVVRRKDGRRRTLPVWFTLQDGVLELLPMYGLKTMWFRDLEESGTMEIKAGNQTRVVSPQVLKDTKTVDRVKGRFSLKYGDGEVRKYYPASEVVLKISL
ncbi:MAG: DUF2255 family protein [Thaumarchaeota archaeon]|nr:DUF2255 family protein [Nitrososphaerota archaeon]